MRVYLPATLPSLRAAAAAGEVGPAPVTAYAVTPTLREWYAEGDAEELEYAALMAAARASLRLLAHASDAPPRRVVIAADVPDSSAQPALDLHRAAVLVGVVPLSDVASVHVDGDDADASVRAAVDAMLAADAGDEDAEFVVGEADAYELQWYATQEIGDL